MVSCPDKTIKMNRDRYSILEKIGEGAYGVVYKALDTDTNKIVALKIILLDTDGEGIPSTALREIGVQQDICSPFIVQLLEVDLRPESLRIVFEYMEQDLRMFLKTLDSNLSPLAIKHIFFQLVTAIDHLHSSNIMHRDMKPQNILIDQLGNCKVCDFGLSRFFSIPLRPYTHEVVTLWYRPPEILLGSPEYSSAVDIWSLGCILAELAMKRPFLPGDSEIDQLFKIFLMFGTPDDNSWHGVSTLRFYSHNFPKWRGYDLYTQLNLLEPRGVELVELMMKIDPRQRINSKQALSHPYFDEIRDSFTPR